MAAETGAKTPAASLKPLAQRATIQAEVAGAEASLRSARALGLKEAASAWTAVQAGELSSASGPL
ncbi:MAG: hypothetical protein ABSG95_09890 [Solirubrobacteraceae bacterium]